MNRNSRRYLGFHLVKRSTVYVEVSEIWGGGGGGYLLGVLIISLSESYYLGPILGFPCRKPPHLEHLVPRQQGLVYTLNPKPKP